MILTPSSLLKLDSFVEKDPRIRKVYDYAKEKYLKAGLLQHNWPHVLRDLFRALVVAEGQPGVNYSILIPAVIMHDIGVTEDEYSRHEERGAEIARRDLPGFGFKEAEIEKVAEAIWLHRGKEEINFIEGQILFDADRLEKSGIAGAFASYRAQMELGKPLSAWAFPRRYRNEDLYTEKARKISGDGFREMDEHFEAVQKSLEARPDWGLKEEDLWEEGQS